MKDHPGRPDIRSSQAWRRLDTEPVTNVREDFHVRPRADARRATDCPIAHDNKKRDMLEWAEHNLDLLAGHELFATATTGHLLQQQPSGCRSPAS